MKTIRTTILDKTQKDDILFLEQACREYDKNHLTFPMEDDILYFLLYDGSTLLSALSAFFDGNSAYECFAFTRPGERRHGYFTMLLEELTEESGEDDILFAVQDPCPDTAATLQSLEAEVCDVEYMMELDLTLAEIAKEPDKDGIITISPKLTTVQPPVKYSFQKNGAAIGHCLLDFRGSTVYFYSFEIEKKLRHKGLGSSCFTRLLTLIKMLPDDVRPETILLQVSGDNRPATALYKKAGFKVVEELDYYLY